MTPTGSPARCSVFRPSPSSPPVICGVAPHQHRAGLRERERHHRERDARDAHAHRAGGERDDHAADERDEDAGPQRNAEVLERDAEAVGAGAEVQRVAERQHPGRSEQQVVRQRERGEHHAQRQQRERARHVGRRGQDAGDRDVQQRQHRHQHDQRDADERPETTDAAALSAVEASCLPPQDVRTAARAARPRAGSRR